MAAAFAALVSLKNNLVLIQNHPRHCFSFEDEQIQSLLENVSSLINFMKNYNHSHGRRAEAAEALERRIARAAQAAEDVIESHIVDQIRDGKTRSNTISCRFLLDVQKVIEDMDYVRRKVINVEARSGVEAEQPTFSSKTETRLTSEKSSMVGFDDILHRLLDLLTGVPSSRIVVPIVGMGGIGKTTLATNVFKHPLIDDHFDIRLWATISQQYWVGSILKQFLSGLRKSTVDESTSGTVNELGEQLYKSLYGRRYLIVLDDMWTLKPWEEIKFFFPDTSDGSRIVVTTRHLDVAKHLGVSRLSLSFLDEDSSWDLFFKKAFQEQGCPPWLEETAKKIVEKCKGLPLAIVVVGGHLRKSSMALEYWENVAHDMNSSLHSAVNDEECLNALSLSYSYLPAHLKPCFLLLGAYPEDENIYSRNIYRLWIAEGLIEPNENTSLDVVTEDYLWDLYERNLVLADGLGFNGKITFVKLHDVVRELCINLGKKEEFLFVLASQQAINRETRVVIRGEAAMVNSQTKTSYAPVHCLIYEGGWPSDDLKLLRTLNTVVPASTSVSIFQQVNLRYLKVNLCSTTLQTLYLSSLISHLWNLQILTIDLPVKSIMIAPYEIWEMLQLRHLEINPVRLVDPLPVDDEANDLVLSHLQTILKVENFRLSEEVIRRIPNIRDLHLLYCDEASSYHCPQNLCYLDKVEYLLCDFDHNSKLSDFALSLIFPSSIKWLFLKGCRVDWEGLTMMVGSLPHLISLRLLWHAVVGSEWTTVGGKFPALKHLEISVCDDLVNWNVDSSHFPVLEALELGYMSKMDEFPPSFGEILTLTAIQLEFCSVASTISAMRMLKEQEEQGNEDLRLHVSLQGDDEELESFNNQIQEEDLTSNNLYLRLHRLPFKSF